VVELDLAAAALNVPEVGMARANLRLGVSKKKDPVVRVELREVSRDQCP